MSLAQLFEVILFDIPDEFLYTVKRRNAGYIIWECTKRRNTGCKAEIRTDLHNQNAEPLKTHSHIGSNSEIGLVRAMAAFKARALNSNIPPGAIYAGVVANTDDAVRIRIPQESSVKRSIRRIRQPIHPPEPNLLQDLVIDGAYSYTKGEDPEQFLLLDNGRDAQNRIIAYATDEDIRLMANSRTYMMDGNFKMSPKNFLQLYVIHVPLGPHNSVPVVYAFLQRKSFDI